MKRFLFLTITAAIITILLLACANQQSDNPQTKEEYRQEIWARWGQLDKQIEELRVEAEKVGTETSIDLIQVIDDLAVQDKIANEQLQELDTTLGDTWLTYRPEIEQTLNELEQAYKEVYQQVATARIKQVEEQIKELRGEVEQTDATANPELADTVSELEAQRDVAIERLDEISTASGPAWKDLKAGLEAALNDLEDAYQQAQSRFEEAS